MSTDSSATTAKIYTFPPRGRFAVNAQRQENQTAFQLPRGVKVASGAWYHDEAIQAEQNRKN